MADNSTFGIVNGGNSPASLVPGTLAPLRLGNQAELVISPLQDYESTYRGQSYNAALQAVGTTTVGLATTYTGLVLYNPIGSTVNLAVGIVSLMQSVLQATQIEAYAIAVGYHATTAPATNTAVTVKSNKVGTTPANVGVAYTISTLPVAPTYHTFLQNTGSATTNGGGVVVDLKGSLILPPGAFACFVTPAQASVAGMWFAFNWREVAI